MRQQGQFKADDVPSAPEPPMHLAVVACGDRLEETLTMAKSAVLFSVKRLHVHIFAEDQLHASFIEAVSCVFVPRDSQDVPRQDPADNGMQHISHALFISAGVVAWFYLLQVQLHGLPHQLPQ